MTLGFRGHPAWRDMSEYVVHFTKDDGTVDPYRTMMSILFQRRLIPGSRFGIASKLAAAPDQDAVCFSEIPLDHLHRLVERRKTKYGIGFHQDILRGAGGARVWYLDQGGPLESAVRDLMRSTSAPGSYADASQPIWKLTPFVDVAGTYAKRRPYRFEWEREWRFQGEFAFSVSDVAFLFIPAELHGAARQFFLDAAKENSGPAYGCPFLDPLWTAEEIEGALESHIPPDFRMG